MRFEERELKPHAEPVSPEELKTGGLKNPLEPLHCETVRCRLSAAEQKAFHRV